LDRIGAWQHLESSRVQPYERMEVWDGVSGSRVQFEWEKKSQDQESTIAYMTENANLVRALLTRLHDLGGVTMLDGQKVAEINLGTQPDSAESQALDLSLWPHVQLSNGRTLVSRLLVGADGFNSPVRSFAGIKSGGWDYERHGVVATLKLPRSRDSPVIAYQRFLPTGPIALLPLPGHFATLVWSTTAAHATHLKTLSHADFVAMVNAAFRLSPVDIEYMHTISSDQADELSWRLRHTPQMAEGIEVPLEVAGVQEKSIASFPLRLRHADTYATHRVALAGDAAHVVHPLAGQGLNMGLGDVDSLSRTIDSATRHGQDIGDQLTLEQYNADRFEPNNRLMGTVDKLHKLYSFGSGPVVTLRSWGLDTVNSIPTLKEFLMRQAAG
jgi:ubiquinone biosynthesis monooxygenase Coq6